MPTLYIMIGIPGAGKNIYAKNRLSHAEYIGADALRKELYDKELTLRGYRKIHRIILERAKASLCQGKDTLIDCANLSAKAQKRYHSILTPNDRMIAVYVHTTLRQALANNRSRSRHVPRLGILFMRLRLDFPLMEEGFHEIITVSKPPSFFGQKKNENYTRQGLHSSPCF